MKQGGNVIASRIVDLGIRRLCFVFLPPGLPLVRKASAAPPTTSILVRGGPGTGKTALAVAMAHSIARESGGAAVYLCTEAAATELPFKASLAGLPEGLVIALDNQHRAAPGTLLVQHLAATDLGQAATTIAQRQRNAIDEAWRLVKTSLKNEQAPPVRCLVVDGFAVPDVPAEPGLGREDMAAFVQALEAQGVSPILIEEAGRGAPDWLSFVTDNVFEMSLEPDPDTGLLRHTLRVTKTRFSLSLAGPHDWGIFHERLTVWPDLLSVVAYSHATQPASVAQPARVFLPVPPRSASLAFGDYEGRFIRLSRTVVFADPNGWMAALPRILRVTPGVRPLTVRVGPITRLTGPDEESTEVRLPDVEGPVALGWVIASMVAERRANAVVLHDIGDMLDPQRTPRAYAHVRRTIHALREIGPLVCIVESSDKFAILRECVDTAAHEEEDKLARGQALLLPKGEFLLAVRWVADLSILPRPVPRSEPDALEAGKLSAAVQAVRQHLMAAHIDEANDALKATRVELAGPATEWAYAELALVRSLAGSPRDALAALGYLADRSSHDAVTVATAYVAALLGLDWLAARLAVLSLANGTHRPQVHVLWHCLCAIYANNDDALDQVLSGADRAVVVRGMQVLILPLLLRALLERNLVGEADRLLRLVAQRWNLDPLIAARLEAEALLAWGSPESWREAIATLERITRDESVSPFHRAETAYNLGLFHQRCQGADVALPWFQRAVQINPNLEPARDRVRALAPPGPAVPT